MYSNLQNLNCAKIFVSCCTKLHFFVFCPNKISWRTEALHQLCNALKQLGHPASMWYTDENYNNRYTLKTPLQQKYNVAASNFYRLKEIDHPNFVWIMFEHYPTKVYESCKKARLVIWYLDIPFSYGNCIDPKNKTLTNCIFLTQCQEGTKTLKQLNLFQPIIEVTNYIDPHYICSEEELEFEQPIKQVVFNNTEAQDHIIALRSLMPDVRFLGAYDHHPTITKDLGLKSCVYLDFGLQFCLSTKMREMVSLGCIPIINRVNTCISTIDIPVPLKYTLNPHQTSDIAYDYEEIRRLINSIFSNFQRAFTDLQPFRSLIRDQNQKFLSSVQTLIDQLT